MMNTDLMLATLLALIACCSAFPYPSGSQGVDPSSQREYTTTLLSSHAFLAFPVNWNLFATEILQILQKTR